MKRALVIYGDSEIGTAIANGIVRRNESDAVRRVAMHQHTPEEWAQMTEDVRRERELIRPAGKVYGAVLLAWAMLWVVIFDAYEYLSAINRGMA